MMMLLLLILLMQDLDLKLDHDHEQQELGLGLYNLNIDIKSQNRVLMCKNSTLYGMSKKPGTGQDMLLVLLLDLLLHL